MTEMGHIVSLFDLLYERQQFDASKLDYSILDATISLLDKLAEVGNSGISVFDLHQKKHVYASYSFSHLFGYDMDELEKDDMAYFNSKIHPDDLQQLRMSSIDMFNFILSVEPCSRLDYKLINEYRMQDAAGSYLRVIEQHQVMELDPDGNVWLSLSILDLSPNQDTDNGVRSQMFNFRLGKLVAIATNQVKVPGALTKKEIQVLNLVKDGFLSKEISGRLSISVHTVNTHRQRILEKLGADNSMEAVKKASSLGLLGN
jgi:DNA-binding CsgD family transcriptional regulator/PAS domain-containing protein